VTRFANMTWFRSGNHGRPKCLPSRKPDIHPTSSNGRV
jgi:hypothetical protein